MRAIYHQCWIRHTYMSCSAVRMNIVLEYVCKCNKKAHIMEAKREKLQMTFFLSTHTLYGGKMHWTDDDSLFRFSAPRMLTRCGQTPSSASFETAVLMSIFCCFDPLFPQSSTWFLSLVCSAGLPLKGSNVAEPTEDSLSAEYSVAERLPSHSRTHPPGPAKQPTEKEREAVLLERISLIKPLRQKRLKRGKRERKNGFLSFFLPSFLLLHVLIS